MIEFTYAKLGWDKVQTYMNDENTAAKNLAVKLGGTVQSREMFPDGLERNIYLLPRAHG